ncbi:MAG: serine hydrolase [Candidatus Dojkabacteria bacterium]|jgi:beta-lactamase class A|nr:serine hydrolase [Candidatus Dojkabacteria bacterium]
MNKKKEKRKNKNISHYLTLLLIFSLGFFLGLFFNSFSQPEDSNSFNQSRLEGYEYINPLIDFESVQSAKVGEIVKLENELERYIDEKTGEYAKNNVTHISVYYKDLNSGAWIGVNENEKFAPASLLKLPVMIAIYKISESDPNFLTTKIQFKREDIGVTQNIDPKQHLEEGKEYTIEELVDRVIRYSDNDSLSAILNNISYEQLIGIYSELGLPNPYEGDPTDIMTVKEYASFFRILYNASYINKDMSEKALKLLSTTEYDAGLASGIPSGVKIANKFGERENLNDYTLARKQLHDCGIVYHPSKPYILCVMTKGANFDSLQVVLKDMSQMVYERVDTR